MADPFLVAESLSARLKAAADPVRASGMRAYMKDHFAYFGIAAPQRRVIVRAVAAEFAVGSRTKASIDDGWLDTLARDLYARDEREHQYVALDILSMHTKRMSPEFLDHTLRFLVTAKSWWDSVDGLQGSGVGALVARHPELVTTVRGWLHTASGPIDKRGAGPFAPSLALARAAIIHQLGRGASTNADVLFEFCAARAADREFFVAKAIGWALRDYSYTAPSAVTDFVSAHSELTPLAAREAMKAIRAGSVARRP